MKITALTTVGLAPKQSDGSKNVEKYKGTDEYKSGNYDWAFDECEKESNGFQDGGWYLPSVDELNYVFGAVHGLSYAQIEELKKGKEIDENAAANTKFAEAVTACGGTGNFLDESLWSSCGASGGEKITYVKFNAPQDGKVKYNQMNNALTNTLKLRCIKKVTVVY